MHSSPLLLLLFHKIFALLFWTSSFLFMAGEGHKHDRKLDKKQDWWHQKLPQKPYCLWLQARITENITGSPDSGSPPSHRPRCTPYGSFLTSKDGMKWSPFVRLNPLVPLKCGRVYDVSITSSESLSSCMLNLNNAFNINNMSEGLNRREARRTYNRPPWWCLQCSLMSYNGACLSE